MKNYLLAASAAIAAVAMAPAANAANFTINLMQSGNVYSADYGNSGLNGDFTDVFTFTPATPDAFGDVTLIQFGSIAASRMTFSAISLDGIDLMPFLHSRNGGNGWDIMVGDLFFGAGEHVLTISGNGGGDASYAGTVNFFAAPIPEAGTWAMMIFGLAAVGFTMRRRSYTARVAFS